MPPHRKGKDDRPRWCDNPAFEDLDIQIINKNMGPAMVDDVMYETKKAFEDNKIEKDIATKLKDFFEGKQEGSSWHCIIGKHFGMSITHATNHIIYFTIKAKNAVAKPHHVILFRSHDRTPGEM